MTQRTSLCLSFCLILLALLSAVARGDSSATSQYPVTPQIEFKELYGAVEQAHVFPDSKTFADAIPKTSPQSILTDYEEHKPDGDAALKEFVAEHFDLPQPSTAITLKPSTSIAGHIDALWPLLTRTTITVPKYSSLLALPAPYVVPGGRFREMYYWDSYFTMLGLEASGQHDAVVNMVNDFAYLINTYGHVPNGTRSYYLSRSQPPFFFAMVGLLSPDNPAKAYAHYLPQLKREYAFWMQGADDLKDGEAHRRVVALADHVVLNRYWDDLALPRDESYAEDTALANNGKRNEAQLYRDIRAAAESGWDFSSRWFKDGQTLATIETTSIIPVDLNSLLYGLENAIHDGCEAVGDKQCVREFAEHAAARRAAMSKYLWNDADSAFFDYNWQTKQPMPSLTAATLYPLFTGVATNDQASKMADTVTKQLLKQGGVVTTLINTGQQWDAPNGWAPLQWLAVDGFNHYKLSNTARLIACRWMVAVNSVYDEKGKLVEKYNVVDPVHGAGGGEYPLQDGFGWTNGVMRKLMVMYPAEAKFRKSKQCDVKVGLH